MYNTRSNTDASDITSTSRCTESRTGRTFALYGIDSSIEDKFLSDISLCNIIGAGTEYVYIPSTGKLFTLDDPISFQMFTLISILTVAIAITLSHNLEFSIGRKSTRIGSIPSLLLIAMLLASAMFATGKRHVLSPYVTLEDRLAIITLCIYVLYYVTRLSLLCIFKGDVKSPINPILATLIIVSARFYGTLDNPYIGILCFLKCGRLLNKLRIFSTCTSNGMMYMWIWDAVDILFDSSILSLVTFIGLTQQYNNDPVIISLYVLQGLYAAMTMNSLISDNC